MTSDIALSICIATLNRAEFLATTLECIASQIVDGIEVVIVDGASTDRTGDVVKAYAARLPHLVYHRLAAKGGVDQDYDRAVVLASGTYCWLFTDDDLLKPGAIAAVVAQLRENYGLVLLNAEVRDATMSLLLEERRMRVRQDSVYGPEMAEQLLVDTADYLSFIGGVVIKRSLWIARDRQSYFGTVFVHVGVIFQAPIEDGVLVLAEPLISIRYGNALWTPRSFEISMFKWPMLVWSFAGFSESAKRRVCAREPWNSITALLIFRARGAFTNREYLTLLHARISSPMRRLLARAIAVLPGCPLNSALVLYLSAFGRFYAQRGVRLVDLRTSRFYYRNVLAKAFV